jgi:hypothetical protein
MRAGTVVLVTIISKCLLVSASSFNINSNSPQSRAGLEWVAKNFVDHPIDSLGFYTQSPSADGSLRLFKRGKGEVAPTRAKIEFHKTTKRERPLRMPGGRITDESALNTAIVTAGSVVVHATAVGAGLLSPPHSIPSAVGYIGLHGVAAGFVYPMAYRAATETIRKARQCLGPQCQRLYENQGKSKQAREDATQEDEVTLDPQKKQLAKKGGRRIAKLVATANSVHAKRSLDERSPLSYPSLEIRRGKEEQMVKRAMRKDIHGCNILHYGRDRKRERPYRVHTLPPLNGQAMLKATALTMTSMATHGTAIKFGLLPAIGSIPTGVGILAAHSMAAGFMAPRAYRASKEILMKVTNCVGPYCRKIYEKLVKSRQESGPEMTGRIVNAPYEVSRRAKKGGRHHAKKAAAIKAAPLVKRSLGDTAIIKTKIVL